MQFRAIYRDNVWSNPCHLGTDCKSALSFIIIFLSYPTHRFKSIVEKVQLIEQLDEKQKQSIFSIIDMAIYNVKLKQTLSNALDL